MCEFCKQFKRDDVGIGEILGRRSVYLAAGSSKVPEDEQFVFCPKCGCRLRNDLSDIESIRDTLRDVLNNDCDIQAYINPEVSDKLLITVDSTVLVVKLSKPKFASDDVDQYVKNLIFED